MGLHLRKTRASLNRKVKTGPSERVDTYSTNVGLISSITHDAIDRTR